jgi:large subunit ribosomal protein L47
MIRSAAARSVTEFFKSSKIDPFKSSTNLEKSGDSWPACFLRLKSFDDLHKLWFVLLKEKNVLLSERQAFRSYNVHQWNGHRSLKKVRLSMKRVLTVLSKRAIHEECKRATELLRSSKKRDVLEKQTGDLKESISRTTLKLDEIGHIQSLSRSIYIAGIRRFQNQLTQIQPRLNELRTKTTEFVSPVWQLSRKYSDLPGSMKWKKPWIRGIEESKKSLVKPH